MMVVPQRRPATAPLKLKCKCQYESQCASRSKRSDDKETTVVAVVSPNAAASYPSAKGNLRCWCKEEEPKHTSPETEDDDEGKDNEGEDDDEGKYEGSDGDNEGDNDDEGKYDGYHGDGSDDEDNKNGCDHDNDKPCHNKTAKVQCRCRPRKYAVGAGYC